MIFSSINQLFDYSKTYVCCNKQAKLFSIMVEPDIGGVFCEDSDFSYLKISNFKYDNSYFTCSFVEKSIDKKLIFDVVIDTHTNKYFLDFKNINDKFYIANTSIIFHCDYECIDCKCQLGFTISLETNTNLAKIIGVWNCFEENTNLYSIGITYETQNIELFYLSNNVEHNFVLPYFDLKLFDRQKLLEQIQQIIIFS